jgi:hypothetical protein
MRPYGGGVRLHHPGFECLALGSGSGHSDFTHSKHRKPVSNNFSGEHFLYRVGASINWSMVEAANWGGPRLGGISIC